MIQGAETTLYAALSPELQDISGVYLEDCEIKEPSKFAQNIDEQDRLWETTNKLLSRWVTNKLWYLVDHSERVIDSKPERLTVR